ncbi:hypothetical protein [Pseudoduganella lutea]|uniref:Uncharacterized protein n=1 Tax=Pseudoduganella lutea TaxID=321985 RepID=A0A4V0Z355_9BURK|nr:hypothetical protein [Pseudoduganella lutea]QBE62263.1 hypothetical protein EWM63_04080 [Pseudoduganella lutea]
MLTDKTMFLALGAVLVIAVLAMDAALTRRRKRRNFHSLCALCGTGLTGRHVEEVKIGGGEIGVQGRVCGRCARRERLIVRAVAGMLVCAFVTAMVAIWPGG